MYSLDYTTSELMAVCAARQIRNDDIAIIGVGIPLIAGVLANSTHAPDAILIYEGGGIGARSRRIPWSIAENPTTDNAIAAAPMWKVLSDCQRGLITLGITGGAEIDRFGNLNSSVIPGENGSYFYPKVRLPGSGGANDIASSAQRTVIMIRLQKGKFVEKVSYITSPGYLSGPGAREKEGLKGGGPYMVITDHCIFKFHSETKEMYLDSLFPGVTVEQVAKAVNWDLQVSKQLSEVEPPTEEEVKVMRTFDSTGTILGRKSVGQKGESFDEFYGKMKAAYQGMHLDL